MGLNQHGAQPALGLNRHGAQPALGLNRHGVEPAKYILLTNCSETNLDTGRRLLYRPI